MRRLALALTVVRGALAVPIGAAIWRGDGSLALGLVVVAALTDLADGPLARRASQASAAGARADVLADAAVLLAATTTMAVRALAPWWMPVLLTGMLVQFVARWRRGLVGYDPIGRYFGAVTFGAVIAVLVLPDDGVRATAAATIAGFAAVGLLTRTRSAQAQKDRGSISVGADAARPA